MTLKIVYTDHSRETLNYTYNYIFNEFGFKAANKFFDKADKTINLLAEFPYMFKESEIDPDVRMGFITKQCSLFYRVTNTEVQILFFWDNRQDPL
ncbi:type II toxin-antitoxin system RelE/ParE family toxin [Mucilaginibacter phyllosphaerae]